MIPLTDAERARLEERDKRLAAWVDEFVAAVDQSSLSAWTGMDSIVAAVNGTSRAVAAVLAAFGATLPAERPPRRSRVAWSKRKHKRARRRA